MKKFKQPILLVLLEAGILLLVSFDKTIVVMLFIAIHLTLFFNRLFKIDFTQNSPSTMVGSIDAVKDDPHASVLQVNELYDKKNPKMKVLQGKWIYLLLIIINAVLLGLMLKGIVPY